LKQILQDLESGETMIVESPVPALKKEHVLIRTTHSLVSPGTERMLLEFGKASLFGKALQQPDKVKIVLNKIHADGLIPTLDAIRSKLQQPIPLGYCNLGVVVDTATSEFKVGDRVISNGSHAEFVRVGKNLCAKVPQDIADDSAVFTVLTSIALQSIRLANPTIGESIAVFGLGPVGLLAVQILLANGCRVLAIDLNSARCELAKKYGADVVDLSRGDYLKSSADYFSRGRGVDAVIIATSTSSNEVIHLSAEISRKRGRIILVGTTGMNLRRDDFFKKELTFQVSASYGPGRYDEMYEELGVDYPAGFIRWTEQRNFEAALDLMSLGKIDTQDLITHRVLIDEAVTAYKLLELPDTLGIVLSYPNNEIDIKTAQTVPITQTIANKKHKNDQGLTPIIGLLGSGNHSSRTIIPALKKNKNIVLHTISGSAGISSHYHGKRASFLYSSTNQESILRSSDINTVLIATRHNLHAEQILQCWSAGMNIYVEKPLCINLEELTAIKNVIEDSQEGSNRIFMVGFNRRFSIFSKKIKQLLNGRPGPKVINMTINAGVIEKYHWTQDPDIGGGRIVGEACHFIDLMVFLLESPIVDIKSTTVSNSKESLRDDIATITLSFEDGSMGTIHYLSNGGKSYPKENIQIFSNGGILELDNFKRLKGYNWRGFRGMYRFRQDKGHVACIEEFIKSIKYGLSNPIPLKEIIDVAEASIKARNQLLKLN